MRASIALMLLSMSEPGSARAISPNIEPIIFRELAMDSRTLPVFWTFTAAPESCVSAAATFLSAPNDEARSVPLKWHLPLGVLFDLLCSSQTAGLPWRVLVHFRNPPPILLRLDLPDTTMSHFMHSFKQSWFLQHGSVQAITDCSAELQRKVWQAGRSSSKPASKRCRAN